MGIEERTSQELIEAHVTIVATLNDLRSDLYSIEAELTARMVQTKATLIDHVTHQAELTTPVEYDRNKLHPLREIVPPEVVAEGYLPEHEVTRTVPESWNMTKVKTWKKYGLAVQKVIADASFPGPAKLTIKPKK